MRFCFVHSLYANKYYYNHTFLDGDSTERVGKAEIGSRVSLILKENERLLLAAAS